MTWRAVSVCGAFADIVAHAHALSWTRDPFDRLIAAQAIAEQAMLLTADQHLRANFDRAIWD